MINVDFEDLYRDVYYQYVKTGKDKSKEYKDGCMSMLVEMGDFAEQYLLDTSYETRLSVVENIILVKVADKYEEKYGLRNRLNYPDMLFCVLKATKYILRMRINKNTSKNIDDRVEDVYDYVKNDFDYKYYAKIQQTEG